MDALTLFLLLSFVIWCCSYALGSSSRLPPGPKGFPIIGNLFQLRENVHQSLWKLSQSYGPLMSLKLGSQTAIIVSSSEIAKEILQKNDHTFSQRFFPDAAQALDHHKFSVFWLPTGSQWRNLRRISKEHMFSTKPLNASQNLRQEKLNELRDYVRQCSVSKKAVNIGEVAFTTSLNLISNTLFSVDFGHYGSNSSQELKEIVCGVMRTLGSPNLANFFPALRLVDLQGMKKQAEFYFGKLLQVFDGIINQRLQERGASSSSTSQGRKDLLEVLLDLNQQNEAEWSIKDIKHLLLDVFTAGTDTSSTTVEWAMAELLCNPEKLAKARAELREVIGQEEENVQESDISRLPYLQAIVKEAFRLHPVGSIMSRKPDIDLEINGFMVPKDALILVNIWGIGRDPNTWLNPNSFEPERFLNSEIDVKGHHFELLSFGTGRRICLGMPLAHRMVHLMLASLLHNFDWKLHTEAEEMDMTEKFGMVVQKAVPLRAIPSGDDC